MYELLIMNYVNNLTPQDINNFAVKKNITLKENEDKIIYDFIIKNWKKIYESKSILTLNELKDKLSNDTYNEIVKLFNYYKEKIV